MASRVDPDEVQAILDTSVTTINIQALIDDANLWVNENLLGEGYTDALLKGIEKYLACHFVTLKDPRMTQHKSGDTTEKYQRDSEVTEYLKAAIAFDTSGKLEKAFVSDEEAPSARFRVGTGYADVNC